MKADTQKILSFGILLLMPIFMCTALIWKMMWYSVGLREDETCAYSFQAVDKGTFWNRGEWHHYVDFNVEGSDPEEYYRWRIVRAPLPSSVWREYPQENLVRVTYRWPSNWKDPFSLNDWEICQLEP